MIRASVLSTVLLLLAADAASAEELPPVVYRQANADYQVTLRIDPALRRHGGVYTRYQDTALRQFNDFERQATQMRDLERRGATGPDHGPFVEEIDVRLALETPHLIGIIQRTYEDQRGAHATPAINGVLLDRASGRAISPVDLLQPGVDMAPLDAALQAGVDKARAARADPRAAPTLPGSRLATWDAGRMAGDRRKPPPSDVTLAPSAEGGAAGGLQFVFGPYEAGAYAEGAYRVVLPAGLFAAQLRPMYRDDFKGEPAALPSDPLQGFPADVKP